jgi:phosphoserine phosphatase
LTLVSITRLRVRSLRYLLAFLLGSLRSAREAKNASGNLAVSLLSDAHLAFWTRTLWTDERSMRAFMFAPAHRAVMPKLLEWCDEAAARTAVVAGGPSSPATGRAHLQGRSSFRSANAF